MYIHIYIYIDMAEVAFLVLLTIRLYLEMDVQNQCHAIRTSFTMFKLCLDNNRPF